MIEYIKVLLRKVIPSDTRVWIKKKKRHLITFIMRYSSHKTTIQELEYILCYKLNITKGDNIFVTSSFGYLNASYSPEEIIRLLESIVTEEGCIMMPYYPPKNSDEWAKGGNVFDMNTTKSGMGILTNVFSKMPNVYMSIHPTKAVCVWGKNAENIVRGHENAETPFHWDSPYGKFLKMGCKTLGLGVTNNPIFHSIEDILLETKTKYYLANKYNLKLIPIDNKTLEIKTYVHNPQFLSRCISSGEYIKTLDCISYKKIEFGHSFIYKIDNSEVLEKTKIIVASGDYKLREK